MENETVEQQQIVDEIVNNAPDQAVEHEQAEPIVSEQAKNFAQLREIASYERSGRERAESERDYYLNIVNQFQQGQQQAPEPQAEHDDIATMGTVYKLRQELVEQKRMLIEDRFKRANSDFDDVVTNHLPQLLKEDPSLKRVLQEMENPYSVVYSMCKAREVLNKPQSQPPVPVSAKKVAQQKKDGDRLVNNAMRPAPASSTQSGLAGEAELFANLSNDQVWALSQKYATGRG